MSTLAPWVPFAVASAFFAGLTAIFGKLGVANIDSDVATLFRTGVILIVIAAIVSVRGEWQGFRQVDAPSAAYLVLSGLATGASWLCYYRALQLGPASRVAPVDKLSVAFAIVLAVVFLGEPATPKVWLGGLLIVAGSLVLAL